MQEINLENISDIDNEESITKLFDEYVKTKDITIRNEIVEKHLYLVEILVLKYLGRGIDYEDLYQTASTALILAAERFDPSRGFSFSSYATPTIIGEIKRYFRDKGWAMKVPRKIKENAVSVREAKEQFLDKNLRYPTVLEVAEMLNLTEEDVLEAMESTQVYQAYSINQLEVSGENGEESIDLEAYTGTVEKGYASVENLDLIEDIMKNLDEKEECVFRLRFIENRPQLDVAHKMNVSQMTVSRIERALKRKFKEEYLGY